MSPAAAWLTSERTVAALGRLDAALDELTGPASPELRTVAAHLLRRRSKRIRPALLLLCAEWGDWDEQALIAAAAAVEALHVATLYHDDVVDRGDVRRGTATVNRMWGTATAEVAGTYLLVRATESLTALGELPAALVCHTALQTCTGEVHEAENAYNVDLTPARYFEIVAQKTATLFELPCRLGARLSGADPSYDEPLAAYGRNLGVAFQIVDDALDFTGSPADLGKAVGSDLRQGVYTLPVLIGLQSRPDVATEIRSRLALRSLDDADVEAVGTAVVQSGAAMQALNTAHTYARGAMSSLDALPDGPARESLARLAEHTIFRTS